EVIQAKPVVAPRDFMVHVGEASYAQNERRAGLVLDEHGNKTGVSSLVIMQPSMVLGAF
ncbi:MAG: hypothetical protein ACI9VR_001381, partial [Cognaticolwellia sp.]